MNAGRVQAFRAEIVHLVDDPAGAREAAWEHWPDGLLVLVDGKVDRCGDARTLAADLPLGVEIIDYPSERRRACAREVADFFLAELLRNGTTTAAVFATVYPLLDEHDGLYLQSHVAENADEVKWVAELYPGSRSYLDVYDRFGLVRERAIYAQCLHLDAADRERMGATGAAMAFCPTSNLFLGRPRVTGCVRGLRPALPAPRLTRPRRPARTRAARGR